MDGQENETLNFDRSSLFLPVFHRQATLTVFVPKPNGSSCNRDVEDPLTLPKQLF